jgi:choline kinase
VANQTLNSDFTAIVLAAGYGSRISGMTDIPKCLLKIGEETLLERNFRIWHNLGIKKVNLVLGYKQEMIRDIAKNYNHWFEFRFLVNENFREQGNTFSLSLGIEDTGASLIFDADLIYDQQILEEFLKDQRPDQILVGPGSLDDIECAKTLADESGYVRMTVDKRAITEEELKRFIFVGEAIGILKFGAETTQNLYVASKEFLSKKENLNLNWEHLLNEFLANQKVGSHQLEAGRWVEIDTPEDFQQAQESFL